jgi:hypothetical protein
MKEAAPLDQLVAYMCLSWLSAQLGDEPPSSGLRGLIWRLVLGSAGQRWQGAELSEFWGVRLWCSRMVQATIHACDGLSLASIKLDGDFSFGVKSKRSRQALPNIEMV